MRDSTEIEILFNIYHLS